MRESNLEGYINSPTIDVTKALIYKLQYLPPEQQQILLDFAEFLVHKNAQTQVIQQRVLGLHQGQIWIIDDFNEPLPDEFWTGE